MAASWRVELEQQQSAELIVQIDDFLANVIMTYTSRKQITEEMVQLIQKHFAELKDAKESAEYNVVDEEDNEEDNATLPWG